MRLISLLLICYSLQATTLYRIAAGSLGGTDPAGNLWAPDAYYTRGQRYIVPGQPIPYSALRFGAAPAGSPFTYTFPVPSGKYTVTLKFIEPNVSAPGKRLFTVTVNSAPIFTDLDLYASAGLLKPMDRTFPVTTSSGITITFTSSTNNAILSGIQIDDDKITPLPLTYLTGLESAPPVCPDTNLTLLLASDSKHLFWCSMGSSWHNVGDVRNGIPGPPGPSLALLGLERCVGSGPGWSCDGYYRARLTLPVGGSMSIIGGIVPPEYPGPISWVNYMVQ